MSATSRATFRRRIAAVLAVPLLLGSASAAAPVSRAHAEQIVHKHTWYFESTRTTVVGEAEIYCNGDFRRLWGAITNYPLTATYNDCF